MTLRALRWPHPAVAVVLCGMLMVWPILFPIFLRVFTPEMPALRGDDLWALYLIAVPLFATWACLVVVPFIRPRRLILDERGVTLDTLWRRQHWAWDAVAGIWPLGGYKCYLEIVADRGRSKRVFLGPYWPGDSAGMARQLTKYREVCRGQEPVEAVLP